MNFKSRTMEQTKSEVRVVEGTCAEVESGFMVLKSGPHSGMEPCTIIIGDKGMPVSEVRKMMEDVKRQVKTATNGRAGVNIVTAIAKKYGVDLTAHSA